MRLIKVLSVIAGVWLIQGCTPSPESELVPVPPAVDRELVAVETDPLALTDAVRLGVLSSTTVQEAELDIQQSGNDVLIARASLYPELYARVSPGRTDGTLANAGAGIQYTLFDFGERAAALDGAIVGVEVSRFALLEQIEQAARTATEQYIFLSIETAQVDTAVAYQRSVASLEDGVRARVDIGIASSVDINEIETAKISADTAVLDARADRSNALEDIASNLGITPKRVHSPARIQDLLAVDSAKTSTLSYESFPRIAALTAQVEQSAFERDAVKAGILPRIGLELGLNLGIDPDDGLTGQGVTLGPSVSEVISLGGGRKERVRNAEIAVEIAERKRQEEIRLARLETVQARTVLSASAERLAQRNDVVALTINTRDLMLGEYEVGTRSLRDLLDAEERIFLAQQDANEALRSHLEALLRYIAATNQLSDYLYETS